MAEKNKEQSKLKGVVMSNSQVAAFVRKHGPATLSKPHGAEKTILYYPNPDYDAAAAADGGEFEDHAGERTPGTRDRVTHRGRQPTRMSSREVVGGGGRASHIPLENLGNPSREAEKADVVNKKDLDEAVLEIEKENLEEKTSPDEDDPTTGVGDKVKKVSQEPVTTDVQDEEIGSTADSGNDEKKDSSKKSSSKNK